MVGIALGGLGVISLRVPFTLSHSFLHLLDLPSILLATFLVVIFALIAYFTNPTEASFRAFLTELAFRQHLSRLNEAQDVEPDDDDDARPHNSTRPLDHKGARKHGSPQGHGQGHGHSSAYAADTPIVFHFANKASISLRTPGYQLRSFAVLTFAIVSPVEMTLPPVLVPNPVHGHAQLPKPISWTNPSTHGAWFIGAFGKWWLGLEMNMRPRQVRLMGQDDAAIRERELSRLRGDDGESVHTNRHSEDTSPIHKASKPSIPRRSSSTVPPRTKAALRERLSLQTSSSHKRDAHAHVPPRPTTPPPLPKSASLPLHTKRIPPPSPETRRAKTERGATPHSPPLLPTSTVPDCNSPARARAPSIQDHSPVIADILKQLDAVRSTTSDLHTQLADFQDASARTHANLQTEVDAARATKKREDAGRAEVKARTKVLDDARRQADGSKREAEKRLKTAAAARDGAAGRIERLGREVEALQQRMIEDGTRMVESRAQAEAERSETSETLVAKREEMKIAEDVVLALTARARDLEATIADETERLQKMKEDVGARRQHAALITSQADTSSWPPPLLASSQSSPRGPFASHQLASTLGTDGVHPSNDLHRSPTSPRPRPLALAGISNLSTAVAHMNGEGNAIKLDSEYAPSQHFRPFANSPVSSTSMPSYTGPLSPVSASLIPSSLIQSIESPRSTLPNGDSFFSLTPAIHSAPSDELHSPVDEPLLPSHINRFDSQRAVFPPRPRSPSREDETAVSKPRRWFSTAAREKGLNPDAKVFTLPHGRPFALGTNSGASTPPTFGSEVFHPSPATESPPPRLSVAGSFFSSLHNPFAPSPAEREALQRALGSGSGNASLERVSSHGSGGSGSAGSGGGSHNASPHWGGDVRRDVSVPTHRSIFNPWATTEGRNE